MIGIVWLWFILSYHSIGNAFNLFSLKSENNLNLFAADSQMKLFTFQNLPF